MVHAKGTAVVAGAGPGTGAALARRFAAAGHPVAMIARDQDRVASLASATPGARAYACDVADAASVAATFATVAADLGPVDTLLFNAGSGVFGPLDTVTPAQFEQAWRVNALGGFLCARAVTPAMQAAGAGNIVFIGATASRRGGAMTAVLASAKAAQRSLAESMARSLWPSGIHVSLIIVDGMVDLATTRARMPDKPDDAFIDPDGIAAIAFDLTRQQRQAWSFEVEARPFRETW